MALSADDAAWLAQLKVARQKLILGQQLASVSSGGRSISIAQLPPEKALAIIDGEIDRLEAADATASGKSRRRGFMRFFY